MNKLFADRSSIFRNWISTK